MWVRIPSPPEDMNRKAKGKNLESYVQERIKFVLNVSDVDVHRSSASGTQSGENSDIYISPTVLLRFPFTIECKNQEQWKLKDLLFDRKSNILRKWIIQAEKENEKLKNLTGLNLYSVVVFSKQHEEVYAMLPEKQQKLLNLNVNHIITNINNQNYIILSFEYWIMNWR